MRRLPALLIAAAATAALAAAAPGAAAPSAGTVALPASLSGPDLTPYDDRVEDRVWQDLVRLPKVPAGYDGTGVTVALIDTGVTPSPDLGARLLARVDLSGERDGVDHFGHGTHMAGIIAGDGTSSAGEWSGAAPGASLVSLKVANWNGAADVTSVIAAIRWAVTNRDRFGIRVINLSYGTDGRQTYRADPLDRAVERATEAGILVVVAAGNQGADATIAKPGDDPQVLTVGAYDDENTLISLQHHVAAFSSRGPTQDGLDKPDIVAPGVSIVSLRAPGSTVDTFRPAARVGDAYFKGTGTSQAAAIVSGVAARVIQADPTLTPSEVKETLIETANDNLVGQPGAGAGAVNARSAVLATLRHALLRTLPAAVAGTGRGTIDGSRGNAVVFADLDRDGSPDAVTGEVDVLGRAWDPESVASAVWDPSTWGRTRWAGVAVETAGSGPADPGTATWGGAAPDAVTWTARNWTDAGWTARNWTARNWTARNWS